MATHQITFDSLDLTEVVETWEDSLATRLNGQLVPKRHGLLISEVPVLEPRRIRLTGRISEADKETLRDTLRLISKTLGHARKKLTLFTDRFFFAYKNSFSWNYIEGSALKSADFVMEFICDDPFEYKTTSDDLPFTLTSADTAIDITNNKYKRSITINNTGNAFVYPIVTVKADQALAVSQAIFRNVTTGRNWTYSGTVSLNNSLEVDSGNLTVKNNNVEDLNNWAGSFVWLDPGNNTIEIQGTPATYRFQFTPRYY